MRISIRNEQRQRVGIAAIKEAAKQTLKKMDCQKVELSILLTNDEGIRKLNKKYRKKDKPTDVLSFPMCGNSELRTPNSELILGDVVISVETAKAQAKENSATLNQEMARLLIHGILHLLGFDHEKGGRRALRMRKQEERLSGGLTIGKR